jgi:Calcineurin-like phosphoesterase
LGKSGNLEAPGADRLPAAEEEAMPAEVHPAKTASSGDHDDLRDSMASSDIPLGDAEVTPEDLSLPHPPGELLPEATAVPSAEMLGHASIPGVPPIVDVRDLDWCAVRDAVNAPAIRARMRAAVERMEALLDTAGGPGMLFDHDRADPADRAIRVSPVDSGTPLWIVGDLHGDLLALEAALALIGVDGASQDAGNRPGMIFLGDLFDDGGFGLEILLRVFELIMQSPGLVCVVAGNHDEALGYDGARFSSTVAPSDFADFLNANLAHEWIERAGKLAVRLFADAPRALFFPDGLLIVHGGFPLADLHPRLAATGDWNEAACLADFVWTRAHPTARKKLPNRFSRGSQFGHQDFAAFCSLATSLGRPVTHMARGHDHVEERYAIYPAYFAHPVLTTVALSRRLDRERFGPYERVPTVARYVEGALPQVYRLHVPADLIREVYPEPEGEYGSGNTTTQEVAGK